MRDIIAVWSIVRTQILGAIVWVCLNEWIRNSDQQPTRTHTRTSHIHTHTRKMEVYSLWWCLEVVGPHDNFLIFSLSFIIRHGNCCANRSTERGTKDVQRHKIHKNTAGWINNLEQCDADAA